MTATSNKGKATPDQWKHIAELKETLDKKLKTIQTKEESNEELTEDEKVIMKDILAQKKERVHNVCNLYIFTCLNDDQKFI